MVLRSHYFFIKDFNLDYAIGFNPNYSSREIQGLISCQRGLKEGKSNLTLPDLSICSSSNVINFDF